MHAVKNMILYKSWEVLRWWVIIFKWITGRPSIPTQQSHERQLLTIKVSRLSWTHKYWSIPDKRTLSAYTSPAVKPCRSSRVHEAAVLRRQASVQSVDLQAPTMPLNGQEKWTSAAQSLCSTPANPLAPSSVFKYRSGTNQAQGPGVLRWPTQHTHNLLDTLSTMSSLPSPQSPSPPWLNLAQGTL